MNLRLSWDEIRVRAAQFAKAWAGKGYEKGEMVLFYRDFFDVFGMPVRRVAEFEKFVTMLGEKRGFIDLFWKGMLLVEQKSKGRSLEEAKKQAFNYLSGIEDSEYPQYLLFSDFQSFVLVDLEENEEYSFTLSNLHNNVEKFGFIMGMQKRKFREQDPVNIKASEIVGKLHDALKDSGYIGHDLEQFLVRLVFCLFADDTGVFQTRDMFYDFLTQRTSVDGFGLGALISDLFQVLNTPIEERVNTLDSELNSFAFINGELFSDTLKIPQFNSSMRKLLIKACEFDWSRISPAIFGSLFQSVMNPKERREQGAHYTSEKNIMKVIEPLFLNDLKGEFERIKRRRDTHRRSELEKFHTRLSKMIFFDPACGCGNFLVIAYREMRLLEVEVIREIRKTAKKQEQLELDARALSVVNVNQFYGIEISEFPVRIAETALWMMDHIMNNFLSLEFGQNYARIPLIASPHIVFGDALELEWEDILPAEKCSVILGNPPFRGAKNQLEKQREQVIEIANLGKSGGTLDYVCAWFLKAGAYLQNSSTQTKIGYVATNSITQGEQVAQLWPILFDKYNLGISFAHRSFQWDSEARGKAHVHVVIVGLVKSDYLPKHRLLYTYDHLKSDPHELSLKMLSPYLINAENLSDPNLVVRETSIRLNSLPKLTSGLQPIDGGIYVFTSEEKRQFLLEEPNAERFFRPYIGSHEFVNGKIRWILVLQDVEPNKLAKLPKVKSQVEKVKRWRKESSRKATRKLASFPKKFGINMIPDRPFLVLPVTSSERRDYLIL